MTIFLENPCIQCVKMMSTRFLCFIYPFAHLPIMMKKENELTWFSCSIYPWVDDTFSLISLYPVHENDVDDTFSLISLYPVQENDVNSTSLLYLPICPSTHHDEERKWVDSFFLFHLPMGRWHFFFNILLSSAGKWCQFDFSALSTHMPIYPSWWRKKRSWLVFPVPSTHG